MIELPILSPPEVYHAGRFLPGADMRSPTSLEGSNLSVSRCPEAWRTILARPHDLPLWRLSREGCAFLDITGLPEATLASIRDWGLAEGLVEERRVARLETWNEQLGRWDVDTELPEEDADALGDCGDGERLTILDALAPTGLDDIYPQKDPLSHRTLDFLAMAWAERRLPELGLEVDGVWWRDPLLVPEGAPEFGSAPRGCIFEARLGLWRREAAVWRPGLDLELAAVPLATRPEVVDVLGLAPPRR